MLDVKKEIILTGEAKVDEQVVIGLSATIRDGERDSYISQNIYNSELYQKNRISLRKEINEFQERVWSEEDSLSEKEKAPSSKS
ncbi:hypothetical protein IGJ41_000312 [Enterococcus sp. DIV1537a]|uniref:hypothetical protein n=1 Tax=Enterococcus sp. DIV1537a TaxID=2774733 RepID=UPI003F2270C6